jgi:hypothetical protein
MVPLPLTNVGKGMLYFDAIAQLSSTRRTQLTLA